MSRSRYSYFDVNGDLISSVQGPGAHASHEGFGLQLHRPGPDGSYLGVPQIPLQLEIGRDGIEPVDRQPILLVDRSNSDTWNDPRPIFWLDRSNRTHLIQLPGGREMYGAQPFGDSDQVAFEPGRAVILRQKGPPGEVELIEIESLGDTVWNRRFQLEPRRLTRQMTDQAAAEMMAIFSHQMPQTPETRLRQAYDEELYRPDFLPSVEGPPILTASGEVWLRTTDLSDTLRVHLVVARDDTEAEPRRVLLPRGLWVHDATETHVWGVLQGVAGVPRIVGRRRVAFGGL